MVGLLKKDGGSEPGHKDLVVFSILHDSKCAECGEELGSGDFLFMETERPLCLRCADLGHLVYLLRGDTALTRRAKKDSALSAVVVRFSRSRGRYERQGILVEESAVHKAEVQCLQDSGQRAARREQEEVRRQQSDYKFSAFVEKAILKLFPGCPPMEAAAIAKHTTMRSSGRVGRTAAAKALEESALTAATIAAIRHDHTRYDELLMKGYDRTDAREAVRDDVHNVLERWRRPSRSHI